MRNIVLCVAMMWAMMVWSQEAVDSVGLAENPLVPDTILVSSLESTPDSVLVGRLQALNSPIALTYNDRVRSFINLYVVKRREQVSRMLVDAEYYFPIFEEALDAHGLPLELKYMAVIESALNPRAFSRAGASGLWQFMYHTGKRFQLNVDSYVDERRDPYKSSWAAAKFMKELYESFGDWHLAIAAYNCGPGNVRKAIARSGGQRDFWKIYYYLPRETRGYVPAFIAAAYAMNYAGEHGIVGVEQNGGLRRGIGVDTVMVVRPLHFEQVRSRVEISMEELRELNPQYRRDIIPAQNGKNYALCLPAEDAVLFAAEEDSIYAFNRLKYFPDNKVVPVADLRYGGPAPAGSVKFIYTVKAGDVPGGIAQKFGVRLADLRYWNGLRRNIIRIDQKLVIYVPKSRADKYDSIAKRQQ